jgi:outer membrane receptor for ferric coprogen and ferric-rhodotorulic acid
MKKVNTNKTFKDLYDFIREVDRDDSGIYQISDDAAFNISEDSVGIYTYRNRVLSICAKGNNGWESVMRFIFRPEEGMVRVYYGAQGFHIYDSWVQYDLNEKISMVVNARSLFLKYYKHEIARLSSAKTLVFNDVENIIMAALLIK